MFNKNQTQTQTTPSPTPQPAGKVNMSAPSILAADLTIAGDLKSKGDIQIDGRIEGNIIASSVTIGEQGFINGKISAIKVLVRGKVTGHISAKSVELTETANVQADIIQDELMVANGAFFDGKCSRKSAPITQSNPAMLTSAKAHPTNPATASKPRS